MKIRFLIFFLVAAVVGWGQTTTITITQSSAGITQNGYNGGAERTWTQDGVDFGAKAVMQENSQPRIQLQANNGVIYNTTAFPGRIISVEVVTAGTARVSTVYGGDSGRLVNSTTGNYTISGGTQFGAGSGDQTWATGTGTNYTYFAIKRGSNAAYFSSVIITYETTPSGPTLTTTGTITSMSTTYGTASATRNFSFNGSNLTGANLTVSAPTGFEIAKTSGGTYSSSLSYAISGGNVSGTVYIRLAATTAAGTYSGNVNLTDGTTNATISVPNSTVNQKALTITGLSADNKVYDGNTSVTITGPPQYSGLVNGETFPVTGTVNWAFSSKDVGSGINITRTGSYDAPSPNYTVVQPTLSADITKKILTISAPVIAPKVYDGDTTTGTITPGAVSGLVGSETLNVSATGTFADPNAGTGKTATVVYTLSNGTNGGLATNYSLTNGTGTGDITKANPVFTTSVINMNIGGTYTLPGPNISSTSDGSFTYSITGGGHATYDGNTTLTGVSAGSETLTVNQAEGTNYLAGSTTVDVNVSDGPCLEEDFSNGLPAGWIATNVSWTEYSGWGSLNAKDGQITTLSLSNPIEFKFDLRRTSNSNSKTLYVEVSTISQTTGFTIVATYNHNNTTNNGLTEVAVDLSPYSNESQVWLRLRKSSSTTSPWRFDNFEVFCDGLPTPIHTYFRSRANGSWTSNSTWESSVDGINWSNATSYPDESAESVVILSGNTVEINSSSVVITNTTVYGTIEVTTDGAYSVDGNDHIELTVEDGGVFLVNSPGEYVPPSGTRFGLVKTGGKLLAASNTTASGTSFANAYLGRASGLFYFGDGAVCEWANPYTTLGSSAPDPGNRNFFRLYEENDIPIFRVTATPVHEFGNSTNDNTFYSIIEIIEPAGFSLGKSGQKTFMAGVRGTGKLIMNDTSGPVNIGTPTVIPELSGTASIVTNDTNGRLRFPNGANVPVGAYFTIENNANANKTFRRSGGTFKIEGTLDITNQSITNTADGSIKVNNGGAIRTRHTGGLYGGGSAIVDFESGKVVLEENSLVELYGDNQSFNAGITYANLKFSGTGIKMPNAGIAIRENGSVTITGDIIVDFSSRNLASNNSNNIAFNMDGGRLILGTTGTKPNMRGEYNITGGVIEFANTNHTVQTIRNSPDYKYQNIEITGTNVGASSGNTALKPNGSFTVKNGGVYTVRQHSIKCYDSTPKGIGAGTGCSVTVENGGLFRTGNDLGFTGTDSDFGNSSSAVDNNITDITLEIGSTVEYLGEKSQEITKEELLTDGRHYYNLIISGDKIEPVTSELKVANVLSIDEHTNGANSYEGKLVIAEWDETGDPNVLYADKGVEVLNGEFILETNAQLMQDADAVNIGDIFVHRKVSDIKNDIDTNMDYIYWSSPVVDQDLHSFSSGTPTEPQHWGFLEYNEATDYFDNTTNDTFHQAKGYAIRAENGTIPNPRKFEFKGTPQNGQINVTVSRTSEEQGFNLIGNPYSSNIFIDDFFAANSSHIHSKAFFWTNKGIYQQYQQGSEYQGNNYAIYTLTGGVPGTGDGGQDSNPNGIVKVGQGFLIQAKQAGTLSFKNDQRDTDAGDFYSKKIKDRYWLTLTSPSSMVNTTLIGYVDGATDSYDHDFDADYWGSSDGLYSLIPERKLIVQGRQFPFDKKDKVQLGADFFEDGVYIINLKDVEGIFTDTRIYLLDKHLAVRHNLKKEPYKFYTEAGVVNDRFEIIYQSGFSTSSNYSNMVTVTSRDKELRVFSVPEDIESVRVFNLTGRLIYEHPAVGQKELRVPLSFLQKQILIIHVYTADGKLTAEKLILR